MFKMFKIYQKKIYKITDKIIQMFKINDKIN